MNFHGIILVLILLLGGQFTVPTRGGIASGVAACTAPSMTNRWPIYTSPPNTCHGGVTCTNGLGAETIVDATGTNNLVAPGSQPIWTTGQVNGLAAAIFNGSNEVLPISTPLSSSNTSWTYYAVVNVPSSPSGNHAIMGCTVTGGCLEWRLNGTHQELLNQNIAVILTGSTTLTPGYHMLLAEYNQSTGLATLKICASGTCTTDATTTNAQALSTSVDSVGAAQGVHDFWNDAIAEAAFANSVSGTIESQVATWGQCKFSL